MDANITIAIISASGVLAGMIAQQMLGSAAASREERRQRRIDVRNRFEECVVRLLEETDPYVHPVPSVPEITRNIIRLQLYLNLADKDHKKLNGHLNSLAISITGYSDSHDKKLLLQNHAAVLDAAIESLKSLVPNLPISVCSLTPLPQLKSLSQSLTRGLTE